MLLSFIQIWLVCYLTGLILLKQDMGKVQWKDVGLCFVFAPLYAMLALLVWHILIDDYLQQRGNS